MSYQKNGEVHIEDDDASAGEKSGHMRWVLGVSLVLVVVLLSAVWMFGAATQGDDEDEVSVSNKINEAGDAEATDGIITDEQVDGDDAQMQDGVSVIENDPE